jgi:glyoxylase-like metal-dependent hydrolase (beta-lactamase superfamily II)
MQTRFVVFALAALVIAPAQNPEQGIPENSVTQVSEHVYAIVGWPNVGIVVGNRATLVIDTGMGARNGAIVAREAEKLTKTPNLYLTTTHFHPEHAMGMQSFPARTILIRPTVQQEEMEKHGSEFIELFRNRSPQFKELLQDVKLRPPDILFDRELKLDLGGVTARLMWFGPGHTRGRRAYLRRTRQRAIARRYRREQAGSLDAERRRESQRLAGYPR